MTKKLALALGVVALTACATVETPETPPTAQELICANTQWEGCMELEAPVVVVSWIVSDHRINFFGGLRGLHYPDEPYVFVNAALTDEAQWQTEVHETVHYLQTKLFPDVTRCESEAAAREVTYELLGVEPGLWRPRYGCDKE